MARPILCTGCDLPVWEAHQTIAEHLACEAAQQAAVRAALDAEADAEPKRDGRFLARHAPLRKAPALRSRASWQGAACRQIEAAAGGACTFEWMEYGKDDAGRWGHCAAFGPDGTRGLWIVRSDNHGHSMRVERLGAAAPAAPALATARRFFVMAIPADGEEAACWFVYDREAGRQIGGEYPDMATADAACRLLRGGR